MSPSPVLAEGVRTRLCVVRAADGPEFLGAAARSRRLHGRWAYPPTTTAQFRAYLARLGQGEDAGLLVRRLDTGALAGFVNLNNVLRGALQSAHLGYAAFSPHQGKGYMSEGLKLTIAYAFNVLGLHRLEASIQPGNDRSVALARAVGMVLEGFSPRYLYIGGKWRDHERWAITSEEWDRWVRTH
ncbi:MAG TPA: GNAT family protein [Acidimicrobiales bacterium]|nr:GNAT family protein [Acidimicrobiales bacterium]